MSTNDKEKTATVTNIKDSRGRIILPRTITDAVILRGEYNAHEYDETGHLVEQVDVEKLEQLEEYLDDLEGRLEAGELRIGNNEKDIDSLEVRMDAAEEQIETNKQDIQTNKENIEANKKAIEDHVAEANKKFKEIDGRLDAAETEIDGLGTRLTSAEEQIEANESAIEANATQIETVSGRVDAAEKSISDNATQISSVSGQVSTLAEQVKAIEDEIDNIEVGTGGGNSTTIIAETIAEMEALKEKDGTICFVKEDSSLHISEGEVWTKVTAAPSEGEETTGSTVQSVETVEELATLEVEEGTLCYVKADENLYIKTGTEWKAIVSGVGGGDSAVAKVVANKDELSALEAEIGTLCYVKEDPDNNFVYIKAESQWIPLGGAGGGVTEQGKLTTTLGTTVSIEDGDSIILPYSYSSPNLGTSTMYVVINRGNSIIERTYTIVRQGASTIDLGSFTTGIYQLQVFILDARGVPTNTLDIYVKCGSLLITSTFNDAQDFSIYGTITIPFNVRAIDESPLISEIYVDGVLIQQQAESGYNSFVLPEDLKTLGLHRIQIQVVSETFVSNYLNYNVAVLDANTLVISAPLEVEAEEGFKFNIDYRVYALNETSFVATYYIDDEEYQVANISRGANTLRVSKRLPSGDHTIRIDVQGETLFSTTEVTAKIKESSFEAIEPVKGGLLAEFDASVRSNNDLDRGTWTSLVAHPISKEPVTAKLYNYNFSSDGWVNGWLKSVTGCYTEIEMAPLADNAPSGITIDILYRSVHIGNNDNLVFSLCNPMPIDPVTGERRETIGFRIDADKAYVKGESSKASTIYTDNEETRITFVINRTMTYVDPDEGVKPCPTVQIYLNGVMTTATILTDLGDTLESFVTTSKIYLNADPNGEYSGESYIKSIRIYDRPLKYEEILQNLIADIDDPEKQKEMYERNLDQKMVDNLIPTMYMYDTKIGNYANMTKDNKQYVRIRYVSPDEEKFGPSFDTITRCAWQGTSSLTYPVKNYKFTMYEMMEDEEGNPTYDIKPEKKMKYNPFGEGHAEDTFCLKAD